MYRQERAPTGARRLASSIHIVLACACGSPVELDAGRELDAGSDAGVVGIDSGTDAGITLEPCTIDDVFTIGALDVSEPDSEAYVVPTEARLGALGRSIDQALAGDLRASIASASSADYTLCEDGEVLVWRPIDTTGQARIAWRRGDVRGIILEAPHPFHDRGTLEEARDLFAALGARALIGSGTHRCANSAPGCEGMSDACGAPSGYRVSDAAHNVVATFQRAHEHLADGFDQDIVVSVHGMGGDGASLSDGTNDPIDASSPVARLAVALVDRGIEMVTSCNDGAGVPVVERLCGSTNTQGRHVNGSADACDMGATAASGRFVHFEQSSALRDRPDDVLAAFEAAL
jgi:hypothetical protein